MSALLIFSFVHGKGRGGWRQRRGRGMVAGKDEGKRRAERKIDYECTGRKYADFGAF